MLDKKNLSQGLVEDGGWDVREPKGLHHVGPDGVEVLQLGPRFQRGHPLEVVVEGVDLEDPREDVVVGEDALPRWGPVLLERDLNLDEQISDLLNHL